MTNALGFRPGRYFLRTNLSADNPKLLWRCYMQ
jgi:hypothetical protein